MKRFEPRVPEPAEKQLWPSFVHPTVAERLKALDPDVGRPPHEGFLFEIYDPGFNGGGDLFFNVYYDRLECMVETVKKPRRKQRRLFAADFEPLEKIYEKAQKIIQ